MEKIPKVAFHPLIYPYSSDQSVQTIFGECSADDNVLFFFNVCVFLFFRRDHFHRWLMHLRGWEYDYIDYITQMFYCALQYHVDTCACVSAIFATFISILRLKDLAYYNRLSGILRKVQYR